ncbi:3-oxoacyl-[acyl-carrier-protein] synthase III [Catalinimonas alkaloidigena]|uniref:3-oxoacyl-[acyl-carrier-protein] synthase III n=1 Tax=Catalinimonas alkaloidigena TaxID=1075417 RepID=A0A1G8WZS4_9BACT|nr:3-oxoacyl-[acyl-carrier-protein] synthase III C-terminal domain-containing protein [Catalinimonas alkaloidigena]SDJ83085.1 3-oxoacyl-[acyl-carrier-protein] synthase III [Catalinimonas alkaloidigena]
MGVIIQHIRSFYERKPAPEVTAVSAPVVDVALQSLRALLRRRPARPVSHLVVATTCPDRLTPSLGQELAAAFPELLGPCHVLDLVQGCTGGASALILGSQLAELHQSAVLVVAAEAAHQATSSASPLHDYFSRGSFACLVEGGPHPQRLLGSLSRQYADLRDVVTVNLGHVTPRVIQAQRQPACDPRRYLGLQMDKRMAMRLLRKAEAFYLDLVRTTGTPDYIILHQVNPGIIGHLKQVFARYPATFVDLAAEVGNCGVATVGVALDRIWPEARGKKVFVCSFGTGGMITGGVWQC